MTTTSPYNSIAGGGKPGDIYSGAITTSATTRPIDIEAWRGPPPAAAASYAPRFIGGALEAERKPSPIVIDMDSDSDEPGDVPMRNAYDTPPEQSAHHSKHRLVNDSSPTAALSGRKTVAKYESVTSLKSSPSPAKVHRSRAKIDAANNFVATPEIRYDICQEILETIGPNRFDWTKVADRHGVDPKKISKVSRAPKGDGDDGS